MRQETDSALPTVIDREILPWVEHPSRYLGTEPNTVRKDARDVDLRWCLAFPDLCDLGVGNLGLQILYHILNRQKGVWAERVYAPAQDMEQHLRRRGLPLFSLESRTPLAQFDALGFTLQWELTYTNLLHMLDLAGLPLQACQRDERFPLVLAGGPGALNPEPLAEFIDAFVVGDGEDVILELNEALREAKGRPREWQLERLSQIQGVYVPALYPTETVRGVPIVVRGSPQVTRRVVYPLDDAAFPTEPVVPFVRQIHDHLNLEVLRGCTRGCRFCQSGMVHRPVRERSLATLDRLLDHSLRGTGYEAVSLVSLSTCDHSRARALIEQSVRRAVAEGVSVSLPSLRIDSFSVEMADLVSVMGKSGLTFAPESATERMRATINKAISDHELLEVAREAYSMEWQHVKLYFMIGLPSEGEDDVHAIADLANRVYEVGRRIRRGATVHVSVSTFVPKPHTPFQWERQIGMEETRVRQGLLSRHLHRGIKFSWHDPHQSLIEGVLARGDRRMSRLLLEAWKSGCRFDGWSEHLDRGKWDAAFLAAEIDPAHGLRARELEERLPWDHIDTLVSRDWLLRELQASRDLALRTDCREGTCHACGVIERQTPACRNRPVSTAQRACTRPGEPATRVERTSEPPPAMKVRFRFVRVGTMRFLAHLEMVNLFLRAFRRARIPASFSQGFNPTPRLAFSCALPVGMETEGDYMDLVLRGRVRIPEMVADLNRVLPEGIAIRDAAEVPLKCPSLMSEVVGERYRATLLDTDPAVLMAVCDATRAFLNRTEILVAKRTKKGTLRQQEIRCAVHGLDAKVTETGELVLDALLVGPGGARPSARDLLESVAPEIPVQRWVVRKLESLVPAETGRTDPITKYRSHGPSSETAPTESGTDPGTET